MFSSIIKNETYSKMVGSHQTSPLEFWDKRIQYKIQKNKGIQKMRNDIIKERQRHLNEKRKQKKSLTIT